MQLEPAKSRLDRLTQSSIPWCIAASSVLVALWWSTALAYAKVTGIADDDGGIDGGSYVYSWLVVLPGVLVGAWIIGPAVGILASRKARSMARVALVVTCTVAIATVTYAMVVSWEIVVIATALLVPSALAGVVADLIRDRTSLHQPQEATTSNKERTRSLHNP